MMRRALRLLGFEIVYVCDWGEYTHRYDDIDRMSTRPIHRNMSVAPPWAKMKIRKITS